MAWQIDAVHSQATFSVRHMMVSTVKGQFTVLSGALEIDEEHPENSWVEAEVDVASIDTRDERRDAHLCAADFFDVEKFPKLTFKSSRVEALGDQQYRVTGDLTIYGVTKEVAFAVDYSGQLKDLYGLQRAGLSAKATIDRKDFGIVTNKTLETGGVLIGDRVNIEIDLAATQQAAPVSETEAATGAKTI